MAGGGLMDLTVGSRHFHISLLVLFAVALGLLWWVARDEGVPGVLERLWESGHQEVQTAGKFHAQLADSAARIAALRARAAHLAQANPALLATLRATQEQLEAAVRATDSLHRAPLTPAVRRYAEACGEAINTCTERAGLLAQALETEHARAQLAMSRVGRADSIIAAGLKLTDCRWLLFKCPSRTTVAEVFFVLGAGTVLVVRR